MSRNHRAGARVSAPDEMTGARPLSVRDCRPLAMHLERDLAELGIDVALAKDGFRAPHPFLVARKSAELGYLMFPLGAQTKIPHVSFPTRATTHPGILKGWERRFRRIGEAGEIIGPNWALMTGRESGARGVVVVDVDGAQGRADLATLESKLGKLPPTWRNNSGRVDGGYHLFFACPPGIDVLMNQQHTGGMSIDIRGWHGYIVISGSRHSSGNRYAWAPGCAPDEIEIAEMPAAWWAHLPKHEETTGAPSRGRTSARGPRAKRNHDPASYKFGDDTGQGGFENPIYKNAIRYFFKAGVDAPAEVILSGLRRMIVAALKGPGRDVSRYLDGPDLPRIVERARNFVKEKESEEKAES